MIQLLGELWRTNHRYIYTCSWRASNLIEDSIEIAPEGSLGFYDISGFDQFQELLTATAAVAPTPPLGVVAPSIPYSLIKPLWQMPAMLQPKGGR
jgi:hypothetical protein